MLNLAIDWDLFTGQNPMRKVKFFRELSLRPRVLSLDEENRLLQCKTPYLQDIIRFVLVLAPKTQRVRTIPLNGVSGQILETEFVFYNHQTGKPFVDLSAGLELACKRADISGVTWHTLRHTLASRLLARGADIITVKELLGHSTVTVTMRYTHTNLEAKVSAVAKLEVHCDNSATFGAKTKVSG